MLRINTKNRTLLLLVFLSPKIKSKDFIHERVSNPKIISRGFGCLHHVTCCFLWGLCGRNPVEILINPDATPEIKQQAIEKLGLDKPILQQYGHFLLGALKGDLGNSFIYDEPALQLILSAMPATLELAICSLLLALVIGIPLGMLAGYWPNSLGSKVIMTASIFGFSLPSFWVGLMLILFFSVGLGWLPSGGRGETVSIGGFPVSFLTWDGLSHLLMPAINLALFKVSLIIRLTRAGMMETMQQDFIKFAKSKVLRTVVL